MENQEQTHKRRVRYKGTHPRNYKEKYKELQPEKYADTVAKVCLLYTSPSPRDYAASRMPSSA